MDFLPGNPDPRHNHKTFPIHWAAPREVCQMPLHSIGCDYDCRLLAHVFVLYKLIWITVTLWMWILTHKRSAENGKTKSQRKKTNLNCKSFSSSVGRDLVESKTTRPVLSLRPESRTTIRRARIQKEFHAPRKNKLMANCKYKGMLPLVATREKYVARLTPSGQLWYCKDMHQ